MIQTDVDIISKSSLSINQQMIISVLCPHLKVKLLIHKAVCACSWASLCNLQNKASTSEFSYISVERNCVKLGSLFIISTVILLVCSNMELVKYMLTVSP